MGDNPISFMLKIYKIIRRIYTAAHLGEKIHRFPYNDTKSKQKQL